MQVSRLQMTVPLAILATLALMLAAIAPAIAAPGGTTGSGPILADHTTDCNATVTVDAEGDLSLDVGGTVLGQAALETLLDAETLAALQLAAEAEAAADADAFVCIDADLTLEGELVVGVTLDADIEICPATVTVNGDGDFELDGVVITDELLAADADLAALLQFAVDADADVCVLVQITDDTVTVDVSLEACINAVLDGDGNVTITLGEGELTLLGDAFVDGTGDLEVDVDAEIGLSITASLDASDALTLTAEIIAIEGCGDAAGPTPTPTPSDGTGAGGVGMVMVMKHLCDASIQSEADFVAVEERSLENPNTPMGVPSLGSTAETVVACPTIVQPGDGQTPGAIGSGSRTFDFTVEDSEGTTQVLTEDTTFSGDNGFDTEVEDFACEDTIAYDVDRDGAIESDVCLDFSSYAFGNVVEGEVTVDEIEAPPSARFGTVRLSPPEITDDAAIGLSFTSDGVMTFDSSLDEDDMVTLHVYNFVNLAGATPTPAASELPDAAVDPIGLTGSNGIAILFGITALASIGFLGYRTVAARRTR